MERSGNSPGPEDSWVEVRSHERAEKNGIDKTASADPTQSDERCVQTGAKAGVSPGDSHGNRCARLANQALPAVSRRAESGRVVAAAVARDILLVPFLRAGWVGAV
ncbi:hypothetical protein CYMTET_40517 [Cymbomonas tetramitiformis]|uniref:Uncharacterized protein n=1 Tax=Cymbomonas tetramitiformis TaxID=36881 RepID=A0AAE0CA57_9CHLO|nr:hypothetical protein CYMTET_40517 [Cymbomonas tetramitiformis]